MKRLRLLSARSAPVLALLALAALGARAQSAESPPGLGAAGSVLELPGSIEPLEKADLHAKVSGYIESISVDIGDRVRAGDVIAVLTIPEMMPELRGAQTAVAEARAQLEKARADANLAKVTYSRFAALHAKEPGAITKQEVDVAEARQSVEAAQVNVAASALASAEAEVEILNALMAYATISAPFDGVITDRMLDTGALVVSGTGGGKPLVELMRTDTLRLVFHVPEPAVSSVKPGTPATVTLDALKQEGAIETSVTRCSGSLMPDTRSMRAEIWLPNADGRIKPGMFAKVVVKTGNEGQSRE